MVRELHLGITGSRKGTTRLASGKFYQVLNALFEIRGDVEMWLEHGDCVGVDQLAHTICKRIGYKISLRPPIQSGLRAFCQDADVVHRPLGYLARDREIVHASEIMIGVPETAWIKPRSGSWYTIKHAHESDVAVWVITPTGKMRRFTGEEDWSARYPADMGC